MHISTYTVPYTKKKRRGKLTKFQDCSGLNVWTIEYLTLHYANGYRNGSDFFN